MYLVSKDHKKEIGKLNLGCNASYKDNKGLKRKLPKTFEMVMEIHILKIEKLSNIQVQFFIEKRDISVD